MFADVDADIYVLVDGDDTYDAAVAPELVDRMIRQRLDFVNGARIETSAGAYRTGHRLRKPSHLGVVRAIFGRDFSDMLSGYKVFSRRFVQSFPSMSRGFEIETEFTIHALELQMPCAEIFTAYRERPAGSASKLRTIPDGIRIAWLILRLDQGREAARLLHAARRALRRCEPRAGHPDRPGVRRNRAGAETAERRAEPPA